MKRIITYILIVAATAFAASCTRENLEPAQGEGSITLRLQTAELETRATVPGEGVENTLTHADFFFFEDEEGTTLLEHKRLEVKEGELVAVGGNAYTYTFDVTDEGNPLQGTSYLYVIANYPNEITATTLEDILDLDIAVSLNPKAPATIASFVMDSYDSASGSVLTALKPYRKDSGTETNPKVFTIGLARAAAKLVLNFNVKDSVVDSFNNEWIPQTDQMWVNFVNARNAATVEAAPVKFDAKANYFTTSQKSPVANGTKTKDGSSYTCWKAEAVYTYPQQFKTEDETAPYFKLYVPWKSEKKGLNNFYYKIILPDLERDADGFNSFKRNKIYQLTVDVSVIGGTEDDWALISDYVYVADWYTPSSVPAAFESALYLDAPVKYFEIYGIEDITVPITSSNEIDVVSVVARQQYVKETLSTIDEKHGKDVPASSYSVTTTGADSFTLTHTLDATIVQQEHTSFDCTPIYFDVTLKHKVPAAGDDTPYLTQAEKTVTVTIVQYPSIYAELVEGGNSFINGYYSLQTASVSNYNESSRSPGNYAADIENDPPKWEAGTAPTYYYYNGHGTVNRTSTSSSIWAGGNPGTGNNANHSVHYGYLNNDYRRTSTMTLITVTAFSSGSNTYTVTSYGDNVRTREYIIGDSRVPSNYTSSSLLPYLNGNTTTNWQDKYAGTIQIGTTTKNIIAPAFLISSERGGRPGSTAGNIDFEKATKRCATYQEAGYPAGRWRLPTEAEIYFVYSLQNMEVISNLFNGGDGYYASSGNVFGWNNNGSANTYTFRDAGTSSHSIRCVYDVWYWGENPAVTGETGTENNIHHYYPGTLNPVEN